MKLATNSENVLKELNARLKSNSSIIVSNEEFDADTIKELAEYGLISIKKGASSFDSKAYLLASTAKGLRYFEDKNYESKKRKRRFLFETIKFATPVIISIASLIVSIIALIK